MLSRGRATFKWNGTLVVRISVFCFEIGPFLLRADGGDTTLQREAFARDLASYEALVLVQARLKTVIIASILPADLVALRDPVHGDRLERRSFPLRTISGSPPRSMPNRRCCPPRRKMSAKSGMLLSSFSVPF